MQDNEFILQFENCTLPKELFKHRGHLRVAWWYLSRQPLSQAIDSISNGIKAYATSLGAAQIYHQTITEAWARLVYLALRKTNQDTFDEFISHHPHLMNSQLLLEYFTPELLASEAAKMKWQEPDIQPLCEESN